MYFFCNCTKLLMYPNDVYVTSYCNSCLKRRAKYHPPVPCCPLIRLCKNIYIYVTATFKHSLFCPFNFNFPLKICYKKICQTFCESYK